MKAALWASGGVAAYLVPGFITLLIWHEEMRRPVLASIVWPVWLLLHALGLR